MCSRRSGTTRAAMALLALFLAGCGATQAAPAGGGAAGGPAAARAADVAGADVVIPVRFEQPAGKGVHWRIRPERIEVPRGARVALVVENDQPLPHDLVLGEPYNRRTPLVRRGERFALTFVADRPTEGTPFWCSVPGHRQLGMEGVLVVR